LIPARSAAATAHVIAAAAARKTLACSERSAGSFVYIAAWDEQSRPRHHDLCREGVVIRREGKT
jgi:hypothetical protein